MVTSMDTFSMLRLTGLLLLALSTSAFGHVEEAENLQAQAWHWSFEPWVIFCLLLSMVWYATGIFRLWRKAGNSRNALVKHSAWFALGWLTLAVALVSPLDPLGVQLFSAHMVQHELMMIVAAPLLVMSRPFGIWMWALPEAWRNRMVNAVRWPGISMPWKFLTRSLVAWIVHALALWVWHVPVFFNTALTNNTVHTWQHVSFLVTALFFWWTVFRDGETRAGCGTAILYLFTTMMHTGALGALLTFAGTPWYAGYSTTSIALGWDPLMDQQLGGLIMWIPGGLVYIGAALTLGARWLQSEPRIRRTP
ncbi:MAG TPA: cytochrome c oxidase assembly protein [Methylophilaceae bacterium]|nr:cytochrome c oxidase assembly protein [Methylophilaceae bacterium]